MPAKDEKTFSYEQSVFASGVATVPDPRLLSDAQYARSLNAYPGRDGRIHKRKGFASDALLAGVREEYMFVTERGASTLIVFHGGFVSSVNLDTGAVTQLGAGISTLGRIAVAGWNDCVYYSDGVNGISHVAWPEEALKAKCSLATSGTPLLRFESVAAGVAGNGISITVVDDGTQVAAPTVPRATVVTVAAGAITITLGQAKVYVAGADYPASPTDYSAKNCASVISAIAASPAAVALVTVTAPGALAATLAVAGVATTAGALAANALAVVADSTQRSFVYLCARQAAERLYGIEAADPTNLRWCAPFDASQWPDGALMSPGGEFTALADTGDTFCAFTRDFLYRIDGTDSATWQTRKVQSDGLGCIAPRSMQVIEGVPVWLSPRGLAYFDGTRPKPLSTDVFDSQRPQVSLVPSDPNPAWTFSYQTGELYVLVFSPDGTHSEAVVYDFRLTAWGGPYVYGFLGVCAAHHLAFPSTARPVIATATGLVREGDIYTDLGAPYLFEADSRTIDGARPLGDKTFNDARAGVTLGAPAEVTLSFLAEKEAVPRSGASKAYSLPAGESLIRKRLPNVRSRSGFDRVSSMCACSLDVYAMGVDLFFNVTRP